MAVGVGVVSAGGLGSVASLPIALLSGWDIARLAYLGVVWRDVWRMSAEQTETRASVTDPARPVADLLLLTAAVASLVVFTIGVTFQVSDTALRPAAIRRTALRHPLFSYLFDTGSWPAPSIWW